MPRSTYEDELSFTVAQFLDIQGWTYTHFPAGEYRPVKVGAKLKRMGLKPGYPDYLIFFPRPSSACTGTAIELKSPKGRLNANQKIVRKQLIEAGWAYFVCRTINEVMAVCECIE